MTEMASGLLEEWRAAVSSDLKLLALLHDCEPPSELLAGLKNNGFPQSLALSLDSVHARQSAALMAETLKQIQGTRAELDLLASDFAAIYLNHSIQASPCESVWLDEEGLMRQQPMFAVRAWYEKYGLAVENWRLRPDDHLVFQLLFISHLVGLDNEIETLRQAIHFMDEHLLLWIKDFAARVEQRAATAYYAALATLTGAYLEKLRQVLEIFLDMPAPGAYAGNNPGSAHYVEL